MKIPTTHGSEGASWTGTKEMFSVRASCLYCGSASSCWVETAFMLATREVMEAGVCALDDCANKVAHVLSKLAGIWEMVSVKGIHHVSLIAGSSIIVS